MSCNSPEVLSTSLVLIFCVCLPKIHLLKTFTMNIVIINGHPFHESLNFAIAKAYKEAAESKGHHVREIVIADLQFNPNLKYGYTKRTELEPDLVRAWETIQWADHQVWIHPVWWGGLPAITKGFIDRLFLPGFTFKYRENSPWWDKLLTGKTAQILTTLDTPPLFYRLMFRRPSVNQLKRTVLEFCGVKPVKVHYFCPIRNAKPEQFKSMIAKARKLVP